MEVLVRLLSYSNHNLRGCTRWWDTFLHYPRAIPEFALIPTSPEGDPQVPNPQLEEEENGVAGSWSGILWGVPKKRTSVMKRLRRRFGHPDWGSPLLKPKTNLRVCDTCGHHYEAFHLCPNCYERVKKETELIRQQAESQFGHGPEDKGIVVLYDSDKDAAGGGAGGIPDPHKAEKNIFVEIPKARPSWFNANLLQRTTLRVNPDVKSVTPTPEKPKIVDDTKSS